MMKLFIDGKQADTDQTTAVSISLGIASITKKSKPEGRDTRKRSACR